MKKLVSKTLVLLLLVVGSIMILNHFYTGTNYWKYLNGVDKFNNVPHEIQLANLGSSHGTESFDYTSIPYRTFNFALGNQRYLYDHAILNHYIENFEKDAVLIILVEYFEITQIISDYGNQVARYYRFLHKETIPEYSLRDHIRYKVFPILSAGGNTTMIFSDIKKNHQRNYSSKTEEDLIGECEKKYSGWINPDLGSGVIEAGEESYAYNQEFICKMVELCLAHDIRPVLVATPITSILNSLYDERSPDFFDAYYYRFIREICEKYPGLTFFDYSHDSRFVNDFSLFSDNDHLNAYGAEKFTHIVVADLEASGMLSKENFGK
jgi:hypothetical protein